MPLHAAIETAFNILHKLRSGMVRQDRDKIGDEWPVEIDECYVGGATRGEGKGVHHKSLVVAAVEVRKKRPPKDPIELKKWLKLPPRQRIYAGRLRLQVVPDRCMDMLTGFVNENIAPKARILSDGWQGYNDLMKLGYKHNRISMNLSIRRACGSPPYSNGLEPLMTTKISGISNGGAEKAREGDAERYRDDTADDAPAGVGHAPQRERLTAQVVDLIRKGRERRVAAEDPGSEEKTKIGIESCAVRTDLQNDPDKECAGAIDDQRSPRKARAVPSKKPDADEVAEHRPGGSAHGDGRKRKGLIHARCAYPCPAE
jgi:hypothetical protein